jgi:hypothetical protein
MRIVRALIFLFSLLAYTCSSIAQDATTPAPAAAPAPVEAPASTGPDEVTVGVYVNDIQQLDLQAHSYAMDFYVWMRWKNPDINPAASLEYMNPFQLWGHISTPLYEAPQDLPDGSKYTAIRYQGQFNSKLPLENYPFDKQNLIIQFEDNSAGAQKQVFVADTNPISLNPELSLPGYIIGSPKLEIKSQPYPTNFGDTRITNFEPYSRVTISVPVQRPTFTYAVKVILPIFLVAACASLIFWIHPSFVEGRIGLGITALLTLVALQMTSNTQLPEVDYLMMIDLLYFTAYLFVVASLAQIVHTSWAAFRGDDEQAILQDRKAFAIAATLFAAIFGTILMSAFRN